MVGGELAPTLHNRADLERYKQSLELCENFVVHPHGALKNKPGSEYVADCKLQDGSTVRLITFQPSAEESYILEVGHEYIRVFDDDGPVYTEPNEELAFNDVTPSGGHQGYNDTVNPTYFAQSFVGDAVNPFDIGMIAFKIRSTYGEIPDDAHVAIFTDDGSGGPGVPGLPLAEVAGLGFEDFQSLWDIGYRDLPYANNDGVFKYFRLKDPTAGAADFPAGTILHAVIRVGPIVAGGPALINVDYSDGDLFLDGSFSRKANFTGGVWAAGAAGRDLCFGVYNNDQAALVELTTPWSATQQDDVGTDSQVSRLVFTQSVDVMTICDGTGATLAYELKRYARTSWDLIELQRFVSVGEPDLVELDGASTQPTAAPTRVWQYAVAGVTVDGFEGLPTLSAEFNVGADISTVKPIVLSITVGDEVVDHYAVYKGRDGTYGFIGQANLPRATAEAYKSGYKNGYGIYPGYDEVFAEYRARNKFRTRAEHESAVAAADAAGKIAGAAAAAAAPNVVTPNVSTFLFADENIAPDYTDQPRNGANPFTEDGGERPRAVAYFQQRRVFANLIGRPDTMLMSEVSDYNSFQRSIPTVDDDAIEATLAQGSLNEIRFLVPLRDLLVMTTGAEHILTGGNKPVTPSNIDAAAVSHRGVGTLHPLVIGNVILFKDIGGAIREWLYEQTSNDFPATDVSLLASHLFKDEESEEPIKITEWALQTSPIPVVYAVRADGMMLAFTYLRDQNVAAWTRLTTDGKYRSVTQARTSESEGETIWTVVERVLGGTKTWVVEKSKPRNERLSPFSDCAVVTELNSQARDGEAFTGDTNWEFMYGTPTWSIDTAAELVDGAICEIRVPRLEIEGALYDPTPVLPDFADTEKRWIVLRDEDGNRYTMRILECLVTTLGVDYATTFRVRLENDIPEALSLAPEGASWELGAKVFDGLDHLEGETVAIRADRGSHAPQVVTGGKVTLNLIANRFAAGLPFESTIRTLALTSQQIDIRSNNKIINKVGIDVLRSKAIWAGESLDNMTMKKPLINDPAQPETGRIEVRPANRWNKSGQFYVQQRDPVPCTLTGFSPEVTVGGD
jgi:hypothetical protein